jgi:hypothetical protein
MSYELEVRADASYGKALSLEEARAIVGQLPGLVENSPAGYSLDRPGAGLHVAVDLCDGNESERLETPPTRVSLVAFSVAYPFLAKSGPVALEMAYQVAEALGWTVFDPQADADTTRGSQVDALRWQGASGTAARIVLERAVSAEASGADIFGQEMRNHSLFGAASSFVLAAVVGAWALLSFGVPKEAFDKYYPWLVSLGGFAVMFLKGLLQASLRLIRSRRRQRS